MRRSKEQTRERILDAAYGLFWRQGFLRVSIDEIAARAGITKRALYQHFRSKDDLMAAALVHSSQMAIARLKNFRRPDRRDEFIDSLFAQLVDWASTPRWSGGGFTRVVVELADQRGHPARAIARKHKATVEEWLADALAAARVGSPHDRARDVMLLMEGAMALMLIHGDRGYATAAAQAAKMLVKPGARRARRAAQPA
jgi:AcrR family transcriptional regulator